MNFQPKGILFVLNATITRCLMVVFLLIIGTYYYTIFKVDKHIPLHAFNSFKPKFANSERPVAHNHLSFGTRSNHMAAVSNAENIKAATKLLTFSTDTIIASAKVDFIDGLNSNCFFVTFGKQKKLRCMPNVFLAGFEKSGSTELHFQIRQHPFIFESSKGKEVHFWDRKGDKPKTVADYTDWYQQGTDLIQYCCLNELPVNTRRFDEQFKENCMKIKQIVGSGHTCPVTLIDSSPAMVYMVDHWDQEPANKGLIAPAVLTPDKLSHVLPSPKIIMIMREPIARLWSDYRWFGKWRKHELTADDFHQVVSNAIDWWNRCNKILPLTRCTYGTNYTGTGLESFFMSHRNSWKELPVLRLRVSLYSLYIERWLQHIPRQQFCFLRFEDYVKEPSILHEKIYPFLNLTTEQSMKDKNKKRPNHKYDNNYYKDVKMHNKTRAMLTEFYRPFNIALAKLLNNDAYLWLDI